MKKLINDIKKRKEIAEIDKFFNTIPKKKTPEDIRKMFYYAVIGFGILFIFMFLGNIFSFWFLLTLVIWVWFFKRSKVFYLEGIYRFRSMIVLFVLIFFVSFMFLGFSANRKSTKSKEPSKSTTLQKYDGKVLNIKSEDGVIEGKGVLKAYTDSIQITYFLLIKDVLPNNGGCIDLVGDWCKDEQHILAESKRYSYMLNFNNTDNYTEISPVYCNEDKLWETATSLSGYVDTYCGVMPLDGWRAADTFYAKNGASFSSYEELLNSTTLTLYDTSDFDRFEETITEKSQTITNVPYTYEEALNPDKIVKQYIISFEE